MYDYPHAVIDRELPGTGQRLPGDWALQHPQDRVEVLQNAVPAAVAAAGIDPTAVIGIGTDFTASTVLPTDTSGTPLCTQHAYAGRPHA